MGAGMTEFHAGQPEDAFSAHFSARGVAILEHALTSSDLARMDALFPKLPARTAGARSEGFSPEARAWLAAHEGLLAIASRLMGSVCVLTRLQAFDKSPLANWFVPWHQDRAEDGRERDLAFLANTLALRIHLDTCEEDCGPLEVIVGSHVHGRLPVTDIARMTRTATGHLCLAARGDIVAIRPLLLHRSQRALRPAARRVIHIEYTSRAYAERLSPAMLAS